MGPTGLMIDLSFGTHTCDSFVCGIRNFSYFVMWKCLSSVEWIEAECTGTALPLLQSLFRHIIPNKLRDFIIFIIINTVLFY